MKDITLTNRLLVGGEVLLYGDVGDVWGDGTGFTDREVLEALSDVKGRDIVVRINSGGGSAWQGFAIYSALRSHNGKVTVMIDALAASAASIIAMAANEVIIAPDAMIMIHDPSTMTWGNSSDHKATAARLDKLADRGAEVYARKTGKTADEMREMMLAETWMDANEAKALGFADTIGGDAGAEMSAFDFTMYGKTPDHIRAAQRTRPEADGATMSVADDDVVLSSDVETASTELPVETPAEAIEPQPAPQALDINQEQKEPPVATKDVVAETGADASLETTDVNMSTKAPADHSGAIFARCSAAKLTMEETSAVMSSAAGDVNKAKDLIIDALAARDTTPEIRQSEPAVVTADARDKFRQGVEKSLLAKSGYAGGEHNEFTGLTLKELARESLVVSGRGAEAKTSDPLKMIGASFVSMSGMHSTSDFVEILANIANKAMLKGYEEAEETFHSWTAKGVLHDFKAVKRVDLGLFPSLSEVPEGAEYQSATVGERGETIQLATYGKMFSITRQAIINDDLNAFTRIPQRMGRAAHRTVGNLVYAILNDNPNMSDGVALFHASHANLLTTGSALAVASIDAARAAMAKQKDSDSIATALNIRPKHLLVPVELEGTARVMLESEFDPAKTQRVPNHVRGIASLVSDARLSGTNWFMAADANMHDTIEVAYLNGNSSPVLEQKDGWNVDGVQFKVRLDAGVKALDFRGLLKATGAAS